MVGDYKWDVLCAKNAGAPCALLIERGEENRVGEGRGLHHHGVDGSDRDNRREETMTNAVVGMVTCSSRAEARKVAKAVLTKKLAACVNIVNGLESHYWWRGKLESAREYLLLIKTTRARTRAVTSAVKAAHSYEVPEIIFLPILAGERRYLGWLAFVRCEDRGRVSAVGVRRLGARGSGR